MAAAMTKIGVVGAGQMGNGIAHVCALAGLPVVLLDVKADALDKAMESAKHTVPLSQASWEYAQKAGAK